jgi:AcrR family transcriptional regulator
MTTTSLVTEFSSVFTEDVSMTSSPTRERLLDEAMRLFGERGYEATSVAEIERSAGLTPGAGGLFHHFRNKEAVLVAGIERHLARLEAVRQIRGAVPPLGDLRAELTLVARYVFLELEEEQELLRVLVSEGRQRPHLLTGAVEQVVRGTFDEFAALLGRSGGTEIAAALALGSLVAFASAELLLGQAPVDADREEVIVTWVDMVTRLVQG